MTGSGKTRLIHKLKNFVDFEGLAKHRGSAFGAHVGESQPQQATFENSLAQALYQVLDYFVLEDESPNIGRCHLPDSFYARMIPAPMVMIETPVRERALEIFKEYIQMPLVSGRPLRELEQSFAQNIERIRNKLGGLECDKIKSILRLAFKAEAMAEEDIAAHLDWIERLLSHYYDKLYQHSLSLKSRKTLYEGSWQDCLDFLKSRQHE
jgi:tRNA 2-selenouridine synthase